MTTKLDLVKEIYSVKNQINTLTESLGEKTKWRIEENLLKLKEESDKNTKEFLKSRLDEFQKRLKEVEIKKYFTSKEGQKVKQDIDLKLNTIRELGRQLKEKTYSQLQKLVKQYLGENWLVNNFNFSRFNISVIDKRNSTPEKKVTYFGQDIEINKYSLNENLTISIGSTGSFDFNDISVGSRGYFYTGVGKFLSNIELKNHIEKILNDSGLKNQELQNEYRNTNENLKDLDLLTQYLNNHVRI